MAFSEDQQQIVDQITSLLQQLEASTEQPEPPPEPVPFEVTDSEFNDLVARVADLEDSTDLIEETLAAMQVTIDDHETRITANEEAIVLINETLTQVIGRQDFEQSRLDKVIKQEDVQVPSILKHFQ